MPEFKLEDVQQATNNALRNIGRAVEIAENPFTKFQLYKHRRKELLRVGTRGNSHVVVKNILHDGITKLHTQDDLGADILDLRFSKGETIVKVGHVLNLSPDQVSRRQRNAIESLAKILWAQEEELRQLERSRIINNLPAKTYSKLFGHRKLVSELLSQMSQTKQPNIISLVGLGGIGKSTLADFAVREAIREIGFSEAFWIRLPKYQLDNARVLTTLTSDALILEIAKHIFEENIPPADYPSELTGFLTSERCIMVIDNLDTEINHVQFLSQIHKFASHTVIIITSRRRFSGLSEVYSANINELSMKDSTSLMIHQVNAIGLDNLTDELNEQSKELFNITGGNPLAIKLVIGLLEILPLQEVLSGLTKTRIEFAEDLYQGIFSYSWKTLSSEDKKLLSIMPLVGEAGATVNHLHKITGLTMGTLISSLQNLTNRCLIEYRGPLESNRYGIHKLTESFLRNQVIKK